MKQEDARRVAKILLAYANGREIESKNDKGKWIAEELADWEMAVDKYRIKPIFDKAVYRPFYTNEECWGEMLKHQPFGWVIRKDEGDSVYALVERIDWGIFFKEVYLEFGEAIYDITFADGSTFGKLIEE